MSYWADDEVISSISIWMMDWALREIPQERGLQKARGNVSVYGKRLS